MLTEMISHSYALVYQRVHTVDGRTPAPVEVGRLSHYLQGFLFILSVVIAGFLNHQKYDFILLMEEIPNNPLGCIKPCK